MQVSDAPAAGSPAGRDSVGAVADDATSDRRSRSGQRFRGALERKRRDAQGGGAQGDGAPEAASAAAMAGWFRAETAAASAKAIGVAGPSGARAVDRILIGAGPEGPQARIRIGAGALAGTEIQLTGGAAGRAVEARLLTHTASSRQTLSVVMDEIRSRLRDRGIVLSTRVPRARANAHAADVERVDDSSPRPLLPDQPVGTRR
jgi:hypothetical protein